MKVTILGCGTSGGVPRIPNHWGACDPKNPKNRRRRASIMVEQGASRIICDTTPDLREQMLSVDVDHLDGVFYTHDHADHTHGIDDLRAYYQISRNQVPVYGDRETMANLERKFDYIFASKEGYPAICEAHVLSGPQTVGNITAVPFKQGHGNGFSLGYRFGDMAYSTDVNALDDAAFGALEGVKVWVVDALRYTPHPTHSHLKQTLEWINRVKPERAILTHMTWEMDYATLKASLPKCVEPAYDGMVIEL